MAFTRYNSNQTSFEIKTEIGDVFTPRFFCDDPAGQVYLTKNPVCKISLIPNPQILGIAIAWDIGTSRSAVGTIDTYSIAFGGATDTGDIVDASFAGVTTGNVIYDNLGEFTLTATVKDTTNNFSSPCKITVNIVDNDIYQRLYFSSVTEGMFFTIPDGTITAINTGLVSGNLLIRDFSVSPLSQNQIATLHNIWAATADGVITSINGGAVWTLINKAALGTPVNTIGDAPAPVTADLDQIGINVLDNLTAQVLRTTVTPNKRAWIYFTTDGGVTWSNVQVS